VFYTTCILYIVFLFALVHYEVATCFRVCKKLACMQSDHPRTRRLSVLAPQQNQHSTLTLIAHSMLRSQRHHNSGYTMTRIMGKEEPRPIYGKFTLWNWFTSSKFLHRIGWFKPVGAGEKIAFQKSILATRGTQFFFVRRSWSLERMFCLSFSSQSTVVGGPGSLSRAQITSSYICEFFAFAMLFLLSIPLLLATKIKHVILVLPFIAAIYLGSRWQHLKSIHKYLTENSSNESSSNVMEVAYYTQPQNVPTDKFCWIVTALEIIFLLIVPLAFVANMGHWKFAGLFIFMGLISFLRRYFSIETVLHEEGIEFIDNSISQITHGSAPSNSLLLMREALESNLKDTTEEQWKTQSLASSVSNMRYSSAYRPCFGISSVFMLGGVLNAISQNSKIKPVSNYEFYPQNFYYERHPKAAYATCDMNHPENFPGLALKDFAFLSESAYRKSSELQPELDSWFNGTGNGIYAKNEFSIVEEHKTSFGDGDANYNLVTFPDYDNFAVISVRGTLTGLDLVADAQLWMSALFLQLFRAVMPLGFIWTPTFTHLASLLSYPESDQNEMVAYYKQTTHFVEWLRETKKYSNIMITALIQIHKIEKANHVNLASLKK